MRCNGSNWAVYSPGSWDGFRNDLWAWWAGVIMRLEHHLVGGYVRYISPHIIIIITMKIYLFLVKQHHWRQVLVGTNILHRYPSLKIRCPTLRLVNYARYWPCGRHIFPDVHLWPWWVGSARASKRWRQIFSTTYAMKSLEWYTWSLSILDRIYRQGTNLPLAPAHPPPPPPLPLSSVHRRGQRPFRSVLRWEYNGEWSRLSHSRRWPGRGRQAASKSGQINQITSESKIVRISSTLKWEIKHW